MSLTTSMFLGLFDWVSDFFKALFDLFPKVVYLLYTSLACVLDVLQLFFRKLAGLDVYYVDGKPVTGDLVTNFITGIFGINPNGFTYSALSTVFWSFVVFGVIVCFMTTIVAIVKSHYSYDDKSAKGPMQYVFTAGKAILNMVAVPIIVILGLYLSQGILTALDSMTSISSANVADIYGDKKDLLRKTQTSSGDDTFIFYDIFGFGSDIIYGNFSSSTPPSDIHLALIGATNQTFSGSMFKVAAFNGNRARLGQIKPKAENYSGTKNMQLFSNAEKSEDLANMIDTAFACNLHLESGMNLDYSSDSGAQWASLKYFTNYLTMNANAFSKFNVGLVWYYYDLWNFNFIIGFAGCLICVTLFINIIMGLLARLFMCIGLFLVAPPLFGLAPLDGGKAGKEWRENFMKQVLMAYGAVVGMNIFFLILPYLNQINFFNINIADYFAQILIIIVGLLTIKAFIATLSGLVGGIDANDSGGKVAEEVGQVAGKATKMTLGAAAMPLSLAINGTKMIKNRIQNKRADKELDDITSADNKTTYAGMTNLQKKAERSRLGVSRRDARAIDGAAPTDPSLGGTLNLRQQSYKKLTDAQRAHRRSTVQGRVTESGNRYRSASGKVRGAIATPLKVADTMFGESKAYLGVKEKSYWAPENYAKTTAGLTKSLYEESIATHRDMRGGFEDVNGHIQTGNATLGGKVDAGTAATTTGFADTQTQLASANSSLGAIKFDTDVTKRASILTATNTKEARKSLAALETKADTVITQNTEAKNTLDKSLKEQTKIRQRTGTVINRVEQVIKNTKKP